jgi:hypothetical protein
MMWERTTPYATPKLCSMLLRHLPVWALGAPAIAPPLLMVLSRRGPAGRPVPMDHPWRLTYPLTKVPFRRIAILVKARSIDEPCGPAAPLAFLSLVLCHSHPRLSPVNVLCPLVMSTNRTIRGRPSTYPWPATQSHSCWQLRSQLLRFQR